MTVRVSTCPDIDRLTAVRPGGGACEECVPIGGRWVHLRVCQACGKTLCCDSSPNRHATRHARSAGHPVIASAQPGERWLYCYVDDLTAGY